MEVATMSGRWYWWWWKMKLQRGREAARGRRCGSVRAPARASFAHSGPLVHSPLHSPSSPHDSNHTEFTVPDCNLHFMICVCDSILCDDGHA